MLTNYEDLSMDQLIERVKELEKIIEEQNIRISEINVIDDLTNLLNRKSLYTALEYEIRRMERIPTFLSVLLIGINDLSKIAKEQGDIIRDIIIQQIAENIQSTTRSADIIGRYDEDVFMIISPDLNPNKGVVVAERIINCIEKDVYPLGIKITTSAGVKHYEGEAANKLLSIAEGYLRLSRKEGKNRPVSSI